MFLDIEKAYDIVNRQIMWELVEILGFNEHKDINPQTPDEVYKSTLVYCRMGFINTSPIFCTVFEQKRSKSVRVIENK